MEKSQREYYLNEQMKAIQSELGGSDASGDEMLELEGNIKKSGMTKEALEKATSELSKLKLMSPMSAEEVSKDVSTRSVLLMSTMVSSGFLFDISS